MFRATKTTLIRLCSLELRPSQGHVRLLGQDVSTFDRNGVAEMRQRIGVVHQDSRFIDHLTLAENVLLPATVSESRNTQIDRHLDELLGWVGLKPLAESLPPELSGGERQRAALARAVILSPDIVLADEPTGNLDAATGAKVVGIMKELNRELGTTLILVTHDHDLAEQANRVIRLSDGAVVSDTSAGTGTPATRCS